MTKKATFRQVLTQKHCSYFNSHFQWTLETPYYIFFNFFFLAHKSPYLDYSRLANLSQLPTVCFPCQIALKFMKPWKRKLTVTGHRNTNESSDQSTVSSVDTSNTVGDLSRPFSKALQAQDSVNLNSGRFLTADVGKWLSKRNTKQKTYLNERSPRKVKKKSLFLGKAPDPKDITPAFPLHLC